MADDDGKVFEGEFEFEAVIPDALFAQGKISSDLLPDQVHNANFEITGIDLTDNDSAERRSASFDNEEEGVVKRALAVLTRWIHQIQPRVKGIRVDVTGNLMPDQYERVKEEVEGQFDAKLPEEADPTAFRDHVIQALFESRMDDVDTKLDEQWESGRESGYESGQESSSEADAEKIAELEKELAGCKSELETLENVAAWRNIVLHEIGDNAIIIRGLQYGTTEFTRSGAEIAIYGPTGDLLRKVEGEDIVEAWDALGEGIAEEKIDPIAETKKTLPEKASKELLNRITLRVRPTSKGPQITQRTGPTLEELEASAESNVSGLGALVKGVFRAHRPGADVQSLAEDRVVEVEKQVQAPQPQSVAGLGLIQALFIRGMVKTPVGDEERFVDLRPPTLDDADRILWAQDWVRDSYGKSELTIGFQARQIEYVGKVTFPWPGKIREVLVGIKWKMQLEAMEKRHQKDLEHENLQLGICLKRNARQKEIIEVRTKELERAGITPSIIPVGDIFQPKLPGLEGLKATEYRPGDVDLGILEDDPGFSVPTAHGLPACIVGDEKSCQIEARERMVQYGAAVLSTGELVGIALGLEEKTAREMLENHGGLIGLFKAPVGSLIQARGVGKKTALKVKSIGELSTRINAADTFTSIPRNVSTPEDLAPLLRPFRLREVESFWLALLNARNNLIAIREVCQGTIDACAMHPRDVFQTAILEGATGIILVHNHPSGNPKPSTEDLALTTRMREGASLLGIRLLDHLIVAGDRIISIRALGLW